MHVIPGRFRYALADRIVKAGEALGLRATDDLNSIKGNRVGYYCHNIRNGRRESAARTFLDRARGRRNLSIMTGALVDRIGFENGRAVGVDARVLGRPMRFACSGEIIVSAGAMESPRHPLTPRVGGLALAVDHEVGDHPGQLGPRLDSQRGGPP